MTKEEAETLLYRWGDWSRSNSNLDYSSMSIIGRMIEQGPGAGHADRNQEISMPDDIAHCEKMVCKMEKIIKKAVITKYVFRVSQADAAKRFHCDRNEVRRRLDAGAMFLAGSFAFSDFQNYACITH